MKVRLSKEVTLQPLSKTKTIVVADAAGLVFIKPRDEVVERYTMRAAKVVAEVERNRPFKILLLNFGKHARRRPKRIFITLA